MKVSGEYILDASCQQIWPKINNPAELVQLIPGCEKIEQVDTNEYRGRIILSVPVVAGAYETTVKIIELDEPNSCIFAGEVSGPSGMIRGQAAFRLIFLEPERTRLEYEGSAIISGALAKMSPRYAEGLAQTLIQQGLEQLNTQLKAESAGQSIAAQGSLGGVLRTLWTAIRIIWQRLFNRGDPKRSARA